MEKGMHRLIADSGRIHDEACEKAVLGTILTNDSAYADAQSYLTADCFYNKDLSSLWQIIKKRKDTGESIDLILLNTDILQKRLDIPLATLAELTTHAVYCDFIPYVLRLAQLSKQRKLYELGAELQQIGVQHLSYDEVEHCTQKARNALDEASKLGTSSVITTLYDGIKEVYTLQRKMKTGEVGFGTMTGFYELDKRGGLQPSDLVIIAGESSQGKTSFANAIALNVIQGSGKVAYYSMEMSTAQLAARFVSMKSGIPSRDMLMSIMDENQSKLFSQAEMSLKSDYLFVDGDSNSSLDKILNSIRSLKLKHNIDGAIIDYLQMLNVNMRSVNKEQAMGDAARRLKNLAKEMNIWIIALSQLNRNAGESHLPTIARIRDSGQIAEAADVVMMVYRPEVYNDGSTFPGELADRETRGYALVDIVKGRNIGIFRFLCKFNAELTLFSDIDNAEVPVMQIQTKSDDTW